MVKIRRMSLVALTVAFVLGLAPTGGGDAADLPVVRVAKAQAIGMPFIPIDIGEAAGIWQKAGIMLDVSAFHGDGQVQQALTAGDIDIAVASGPGLGFVAKGVPAIAVGTLTGAPNSIGLVMGIKSTVKSAADLKGKRIGVSQAGSLTDWLVRQLAIQQGWAPTAITTVGLGDTRAQAAAMETGEIDGICTGSEYGFDLQDHNKGRMLLTFGPVVPHFLTQVIYARNDFVAQHPDLVQKFLLGWYRSVGWMKAHRTQSIAMAVKIEGLDELAESQTFDATMPVMSNDGQFQPAAVERLGKSFVELGILDQVPDMNKLITRRFVPVKT